jgi:hypothetical protein
MDRQRKRRQTVSLDERLMQAARDHRERAEQKQGAEREALLKKRASSKLRSRLTAPYSDTARDQP